MVTCGAGEDCALRPLWVEPVPCTLMSKEGGGMVIRMGGAHVFCRVQEEAWEVVSGGVQGGEGLIECREGDGMERGHIEGGGQILGVRG